MTETFASHECKEIQESELRIMFMYGKWSLLVAGQYLTDIQYCPFCGKELE